MPSETTGLRSLGSVAASSTGRQHSATGSAISVNAEAASKRLLEARPFSNDRAAVDSLERHCGVNFNTVDWTPDNRPLHMIIPKRDTTPDWSKALRILQALNAPTPERLINAWLAKLAVKTAAPRGTDETNEMKIAAYCQDLQPYPADVVKEALEELAEESTFFPAWAEVVAKLKYETAWRRCALRALRDAMERQGVA